MTFTVISQAGEDVSVEFFKVPALAAGQIGEIIVDWGDGRMQAPSFSLDDKTLNEMVESEDLVPFVCLTHKYADDGKRTVAIKAPMGWLPLKSLPFQTISIDSALPKLTVGETDEKFRLAASDTLFPIACAGSADGLGRLSSVHSDLLVSNPQLEYFDNAFAHTELKAVPPRLFSPCQRLSSLTKAFADTEIEAIEPLTLSQADESTICEQTFARCKKLRSVENPFREGIYPICMEDFLNQAPCSLFDWCAPERREECGWRRPEATIDNPSFDFDWIAANDKPQTVLSFYPIDLALNGDLLVDWGDGKQESIDWNRVQDLKHAFPKAGVYRIKLHYTPREAVRPFRLGEHTKAIYTVLPLWHPRTVESRGDFNGWAANLRELETVEVPIFAANPEITNLEQAFAGCVELAHIPDDILSGLKQVNVNGMFAFCKHLKALPTDYTAIDRDTSLDCFYPQLS